jgi:hypothetical protein
MTDRWPQTEKLCQSALELEESQRAAFLDEACRDDEALRQEVESLLQYDQRGERFIEELAVEVAAKMMAHEEPESLLRQQLGSYQPEAGVDREYCIQFLSFAKGKVRTVAPMCGRPPAGLSVSPDGRFLLFSQTGEAGSDLMLVGNFRWEKQ